MAHFFAEGCFSHDYLMRTLRVVSILLVISIWESPRDHRESCMMHFIESCIITLCTCLSLVLTQLKDQLLQVERLFRLLFTALRAMFLSIVTLLLCIETAQSLYCFSKWPIDNSTVTTNLTYCLSAFAVYERKQLSENEIADVRQPNICEKANGFARICTYQTARVTERGATNILVCCCGLDFCNTFNMSEEFEKKRQLAPVCADSRDMKSVRENKAVFSPFCYKKLLFDHQNIKNDQKWRLRKQVVEMGPDSHGSNPIKVGYFGCGSGIEAGKCALTRFYATPMNHLRMITDEHQPAFICCCNKIHCNLNIPIKKCWSVYQALGFNESRVIASELCGYPSSSALTQRNETSARSHVEQWKANQKGVIALLVAVRLMV